MDKPKTMPKIDKGESLLDYVLTSQSDVPTSLATRLIFNFIAIIVILSIIFTVVGIHLISNRIISEAQDMVHQDLNSAREIYSSKLGRISDVIAFTANRFFIRDAILSGNLTQTIQELQNVKNNEGLDILNITDNQGNVIMRADNPGIIGDNQSHIDLIRAVLINDEPYSATSIIASEDLRKESPALAQQAYFHLVDTPMARVSSVSEITSGMMLLSAAPILDYQGNLIGVLYGGTLINRNYGIVDKIKQTVFQNVKYNDKDIGTATIFQDDVRISTNVLNTDGSRAIGTQVTEEVYNRVVKGGEAWIGRAYVVNNWYITAYEPIRNINNQIIGILYVGILEQKYVDIRRGTIFAFIGVALLGVLVSILLSYFISRKISVPIKELVSASREVASGNLDAKVEIVSDDELGELADSFNVMASALKKRDEQLKEFTRNKIMESEKLAVIGQLSANVAHELNNPLQGIVTYSYLLLEKMDSENSSRDSIEKIVIQANRCRDIIRGLLDFARQRKPDKTLCDVNSILHECISLVENQAIFLNIQIDINLTKDLPMVIIDPSQIERVFMNMIINAAEAMDGNGQLTITTRADQGNNFIDVIFKDTGHGISEQHMEKIFDPFFTTKETGHGVGLGLAISYGIIKEHKGSISVESQIEKGTTFTIRLPITVEEEVSGNGRK